MIKKILMIFTLDSIRQMTENINQMVRQEGTGITEIQPIAVLNHIYNPKFIQIKSDDEKEFSENAKSNLIEIIKRDIHEKIQQDKNSRETFLKQLDKKSPESLVDIENIKNIINTVKKEYSYIGDVSYYIVEDAKKRQDVNDQGEIAFEYWILAETDENIEHLEMLLENTLYNMTQCKHLINCQLFISEFINKISKRTMADKEPQINMPGYKEFFTLDELYTKIDSGSGEALLDRGMKYLYDKKHIIEEMIDYAIDNQHDPIEFLYKNAEKYNLHEKEDVKILGSMLKNSHSIKSVTDIYVMLFSITLELKRDLYILGVEKGNIVEEIIKHIEEIPELFMKKKKTLKEKLKKTKTNCIWAYQLLERRKESIEADKLLQKKNRLLQRYTLIYFKIENYNRIYNQIEKYRSKLPTDILSKFTQSGKIYLEKKLEKLYDFFYIEEEEEEEPIITFNAKELIKGMKEKCKSKSTNIMNIWLLGINISILITLLLIYILSRPKRTD